MNLRMSWKWLALALLSLPFWETCALGQTIAGIQAPIPDIPLPAEPPPAVEVITPLTPIVAEQTQPVIPSTASQKDVEKIVADYLKKKETEKKEAEEKKKQEAEEKKFNDHYGGTRYDLLSLYDELSLPSDAPKKWYDKFSIRGYTQVRFDRTLTKEDRSAAPNLFSDRFINGSNENFGIRRARIIFSGDVSDYLSLYFQADFATVAQTGSSAYYFGQARDLYGDVYLDKDRVHRFRVGLSKVPYGFDNIQSSQNRVTLDRSDPFNSAEPNERDLGVFYYWTPVEEQKLFKSLAESGLKGSGNFGLFGIGVYDGQNQPSIDLNYNLHTVARATYPFQLPSSQVVEVSLQGYTGYYVVPGAIIRPLGRGSATLTPANTGGNDGVLDQRIAASFIWYPQPFGIQAEWQVGRGPGLSDDQTRVEARHLDGGYITGMYRQPTKSFGIVTPYSRYQQFTGGYKNQPNAPYGHQRQIDLGIEWQIRKEMELTLEYGRASTPNFTASTTPGVRPYSDFTGSIFRVQFQINY